MMWITPPSNSMSCKGRGPISKEEKGEEEGEEVEEGVEIPYRFGDISSHLESTVEADSLAICDSLDNLAARDILVLGVIEERRDEGRGLLHVGGHVGAIEHMVRQQRGDEPGVLGFGHGGALEQLADGIVVRGEDGDVGGALQGFEDFGVVADEF